MAFLIWVDFNFVRAQGAGEKKIQAQEIWDENRGSYIYSREDHEGSNYERKGDTLIH